MASISDDLLVKIELIISVYCMRFPSTPRKKTSHDGNLWDQVTLPTNTGWVVDPHHPTLSGNQTWLVGRFPLDDSLNLHFRFPRLPRFFHGWFPGLTSALKKVPYPMTDPCMYAIYIYMVTFTINNIAYMDPHLPTKKPPVFGSASIYQPDPIRIWLLVEARRGQRCSGPWSSTLHRLPGLTDHWCEVQVGMANKNPCAP